MARKSMKEKAAAAFFLKCQSGGFAKFTNFAGYD